MVVHVDRISPWHVNFFKDGTEAIGLETCRAGGHLSKRGNKSYVMSVVDSTTSFN